MLCCALLLQHGTVATPPAHVTAEDSRQGGGLYRPHVDSLFNESCQARRLKCGSDRPRTDRSPHPADCVKLLVVCHFRVLTGSIYLKFRVTRGGFG
jgi:hypothetical protein